MKKVKTFIRRIKRHKRNKRLSEFADNIFFAVSNRCWYGNVFIHPLIYKIIRIRYLHNDALVQLYSCLRVDYFAKDLTSIIIGA